MADAVVVIRLEDKASGVIDGVGSKAKTLEGRFKSLAKSAVAKLGAITAATFAVGKAFDTLKGLSQAEAALGSLGVNADQATAAFTKLSSQLNGQASAVELTAAAYDVASAGFGSVVEQTKILEAATKGAVGGMSDLNTVGNAVTSVLNSYGMSADQAGKLVDGFIQTQNDGKIILEQYASQIGRLAPTAAAAGVGIEELNAAISTITAKGVAPEQTITGLNMALVALLKPSGEAEKLAKNLGIEFNEAALKSKGFGGVLKDVVKATGGSTTQMTKLFGSVDALKAVLALTNDDLKSFEKNLENQKKATGVADQAFKKMSDTLGGALKGLDSAFKNFVVAFKPVMPLIVKPIELLAGAIQLAADNFRALASAAAFVGTLAAFAKAAAIAQALLAAKTALLALKTKAAAVAAATLQMVMNPANILKIGAALGAAALTAATLGTAMDTAAEEAALGQGELKEAAKGAKDQIEGQVTATDNVVAAKQRAVEASRNALAALQQETVELNKQKQSFENAVAITDARLKAETAINQMQHNALQIAYENAGSARERLGIAKQIYQNEVQGARLAYQQTINSIEAEKTRLEFRRQAAVLEGEMIRARGELAAAEAEANGANQAQIDKILAKTQQAVDVQRQNVQLIDGQIAAQKQIGEFQKTAAQAQLKATEQTAQQKLKQKLVSDEIGMSNEAANTLVGKISQSSTNANTLSTNTSRVATNASNAAGNFIRVATAADQAANSIMRAAQAQAALNRARASRSRGGGGGGGGTVSQAKGGYNLGSFTPFAKGGVVKGPTLGLIGEGGEPEYIIPESKAAGFAANFLSGKRGISAVPGFADGGMAVPASASVSIQTGPVTQMGGQNYVTTADLGAAVEAGVLQTLDILRRDQTTRASMGLS